MRITADIRFEAGDRLAATVHPEGVRVASPDRHPGQGAVWFDDEAELFRALAEAGLRPPPEPSPNPQPEEHE